MKTLVSIPDALRIPLLNEYQTILQNFIENRWMPSELSGGRFCEVVFTIVSGYAAGSYPTVPSKPRNFVEACRRLENNPSVPRSFQILIPRLLPALYEIRNNRGVGHVGGDVDSNFMDASAVVAMASWILSELVRVYHDVSIEEAQRIVDQLNERRIPIVWKSGDTKRVLDTSLGIKDQILVLAASCSGKVSFDELLGWTEYRNIAYFKKLLTKLHSDRMIEYDRGLRKV